MSQGRLVDKTAVITGAGLGIGRGLARRFAKEGARVVVNDYNAQAGDKVVEEIRAMGGEAVFCYGDVATRSGAQSSVALCLEKWGKIDVLVNNAWGGGQISRVESKTDEGMQHAFSIGQMAAWWAMQAALPSMKGNGSGSIINFGSLNGVNAHMFTVEYNMAKEAIRALTRTAAVEWGPYNIRCNIICPAAATESYEAFRSANPEVAEELNAQKPIPRMGDPETDIAGAALFLASDDSAYVTGNTLFVDGGGHINGVQWRPALPDS